MPVITFSSPKGGAGKTTAAVIVASELALRGASVTVIDADENTNVVDWHKLGDAPAKLIVLGDKKDSPITEDSIIEAI